MRSSEIKAAPKIPSWMQAASDRLKAEEAAQIEKRKHSKQVKTMVSQKNCVLESSFPVSSVSMDDKPKLWGAHRSEINVPPMSDSTQIKMHGRNESRLLLFRNSLLEGRDMEESSYNEKELEDVLKIEQLTFADEAEDDEADSSSKSRLDDLIRSAKARMRESCERALVTRETQKIGSIDSLDNNNDSFGDVESGSFAKLKLDLMSDIDDIFRRVIDAREEHRKGAEDFKAQLKRCT